MKLPGGDHAVVELAKLTDYCLDETHPRGRHEARVFAARLGVVRPGWIVRTGEDFPRLTSCYLL